MNPNLNVPYTFNVYDVNNKLTTICIADFFQTNLHWGITTCTATNQPIPNNPAGFFIDIQILITTGTNTNPFDCFSVDVTPLMPQNPQYGQVTITNPDGTKSTTKIHLESATVKP